MKVLVGQFMTESNANIPARCQLEDYELAFGQKCIDRMRCRDVFERNGVEIVPSIYANSGSAGIIEKNAYTYIHNRLIRDIKENMDTLDGIFLHLHGASEVEDLLGGSGDHHILQSIRDLVGDYLPIAIVCDPHGNLSQAYVDNTTIIRSYRETPHTDMDDTVNGVAKLLIDTIQSRNYTKPVYRKLPLILGGEQSVSKDEPVNSINHFLNEIEMDPRIMSCSWHVGYLRHDTDVAGCGVVVVPRSLEHTAYASQQADLIYDFIWERRHEFHYTGTTMQPDDALQAAIEFEGSPVFVTDSGDNVTSGSHGGNTFILRQLLSHENRNSKRYLFASIHDESTLRELLSHELHSQIQINLGMGFNDLTESVPLDVILLSKGSLKGGFYETENSDVVGDCVLVRVKDTLIDIVVADCNAPFCEEPQFASAGVSWNDYDVIVVKQGYIFPNLEANSKWAVMSLTDGPTPQDTKAIPFKRIMRPMFPIDNI
ncbi:M81 family metallopeptidase [Erysipelothrix sp. HDW6C]|uniref:M81 family metallopeptidase n=1 Tax=Erysipelothrix sp. HDW6C TaxID=2714930 RepID=UPI00140B246C|nr:M81 family metallopeptidase [Erysipelothrix sp. HDW6C]QIK70276.1 M81 family metallopeptidase [Erysipelothrix sp. HDW6C]